MRTNGEPERIRKEPLDFEVSDFLLFAGYLKRQTQTLAKETQKQLLVHWYSAGGHAKKPTLNPQISHSFFRVRIFFPFLVAQRYHF